MMNEEEQLVREQINNEVFGDGEVYKEPEVEEKPEDPWADVSPAIRETLESLKSRLGDIDTIHSRLKQAESRIGGAERRLHEASKVVEKPTAEQVQKAADNTKAWEGLREDFPEWAEAMDSVKNDFTSKTAELEGRIANVDEIREQLQTDFSEKLSTVQKSFEIRLVDRAHKGWRQTVVSEDYKNWLAAQPLDIKEKVQSESADDAIEVLDLFEESRGNKNPANIIEQRKQRLEAAVDTRTTRKPTKQKSIDDMSDEEYRAYVFKQEFKE